MLIGIIYFLYLVRIVLLPFVLAILIVYLVEPFIDCLLNRGVGRNLALALILFLVAGGIFLFGFFAAPYLIEELNTLAQRLPVYAKEIQNIIDLINDKYERIDLPPAIQTIIDNSLSRIQSVTLRFVERTTEVIIGLLSSFFSLVMAPILAFYMLKDIDLIKKNMWSLVPKAYRKEVKQLLKKIDDVLRGYLKGQLLVSIVVGLLLSLGFYILKVKFYLLIGIFAGIMNLIPYLGVVLGILPALFIVSFKSTQAIIGVVVLYLIVQQLESSLISPKIVGDKVGLHPIIIIFSLLVGGELLGIIGMLLAVPIAGIIKVIINHFISRII
ncbi:MULTISPECIES: AI-2E family transporter [unclassified Candidatus Frackibacter]|uniref:AI-2E family transporter n=1 Tax=unclassified Candidatus Frackibacter TaxID=2648818 RepID=UPI0021006ABD|nr:MULTISPECIES: AI-2E family transporter [unclassified Candidatus Frackibacter]